MTRLTEQRADFALITEWVPEQGAVLDLGCGDGELLLTLQEKRDIQQGYGVEIDERKVLHCLQNGVNVIQANLEEGLSMFEDQSFDVVILSQTIQAMKNTEHIVQDMLRVGREVIVSFPNFGYWPHRFQIGIGQMPVSDRLPHAWHNTPNIHLCTMYDFDRFCAERSIRILDRIAFNHGKRQTLWPNLFATLAIYRLCQAH
jgi:methionine biosynthesis protein MetW